MLGVGLAVSKVAFEKSKTTASAMQAPESPLPANAVIQVIRKTGPIFIARGARTNAETRWRSAAGAS
jgi:hypothetical protein